MKKCNQKGFILAETLVVTVFLLTIFALLYKNFYPLMGEFEKRENYDDVDGKYSAYWIKKLIEDPTYDMNPASERGRNFTNIDGSGNDIGYGYMRFECSDIIADDERQAQCRSLVRALEVSGCDNLGNNCEIYITKYRIGSEAAGVWFKNSVKTNLKRFRENCSPTISDDACRDAYVHKCKEGLSGDETTKEIKCERRANKNVFSSGFEDYIVSLPDYSTESLNDAKYRVIVVFHHTKDNNNYYSYATMEVSR